MSAYRAISWDRQKKRYDVVLAGLIMLALLSFALTTLWRMPESTAETLILRSTALTALVLLHVILCIGPLARLDRRFLVLLYNRRHLGVTMFFLALVHGTFAIIQYNAGGNANPLVAALTAYRRDYDLFAAGCGLQHFPFEVFGVIALSILFLMAATSHDFWLRNLGASFWKALHLLVYLAYGLILVHVALGFLQSEHHPAYVVLLGLGLALVAGQHLVSGWREWHAARTMGGTATADGYVPVCAVADLRESRAVTVALGGGRAAVWLHQGKVFATSNVCRHQGGPLSEGKILDGCITCPWHGWNYRVETGMSPPPFKEVVPTYAVRVQAGVVYVQPTALPLGTASAGAAAGADT